MCSYHQPIFSPQLFCHWRLCQGRRHGWGRAGTLAGVVGAATAKEALATTVVSHQTVFHSPLHHGTSERQGGVHRGFSKRIDTILNELNWTKPNSGLWRCIPLNTVWCPVCDIYMMAKVVHRNWSDNYCDQSDTQLSILLLEFCQQTSLSLCTLLHCFVAVFCLFVFNYLFCFWEPVKENNSWHNLTPFWFLFWYMLILTGEIIEITG